MPHDDIRETIRPAFTSALRLALINAGMDTARGALLMVSAAHTEKDINDTVNAYEEALTALQKEEVL